MSGEISLRASFRVRKRKGYKVLAHPERRMIDRMLLSGYSPDRVADWLESNHPEATVSDVTILNYRRNYIKPQAILKSTEVEKILKRVYVQVDALQELYKAYEIQKRRVARGLSIERSTGEPAPVTRKDMELLVSTLKDILILEMDLGVRAKSPLVIEERKLDLEALLGRMVDEEMLLEKNR